MHVPDFDLHSKIVDLSTSANILSRDDRRHRLSECKQPSWLKDIPRIIKICTEKE